MFRGELHEQNNPSSRPPLIEPTRYSRTSSVVAVETGCLAGDRLQAAVVAAWSIAHGLSVLLATGANFQLASTRPTRIVWAKDVLEFFVMSIMPKAPTIKPHSPRRSALNRDSVERLRAARTG